MDESVYFVRGCTALLDAVGGAIHHIGNVHKYAREEDRPEKTLFVITTDGMENASHRYDAEKVKQMIERQKEKYGWEFLFLGANRAVNYHADHKGTGVIFGSASDAISEVRCCAAVPLSDNWRQKIDEDYQARKK